MTTVLQNVTLSCDLTSPVSYQAGQELECVISFTASEEGKYYLLGALYTAKLEYISGSLFGVLVPEGSDYSVNSVQYASLWKLEAGESKELSSKFTFDRTDVVLGLFLMKMAGDELSLEEDEQVGTLSVQLSSPAPPITFESLMPLVMVVGMCGFMVYEALKD
jgi:hypothetical protein